MMHEKVEPKSARKIWKYWSSRTHILSFTFLAIPTTCSCLPTTSRTTSTSSSIGIISDSHHIHGWDTVRLLLLHLCDLLMMMVFDLLPVMSSSEPLRPASRKDAKYLRHGATAPKGRRNSFHKCKRIKEGGNAMKSKKEPSAKEEMIRSRGESYFQSHEKKKVTVDAVMTGGRSA